MKFKFYKKINCPVSENFISNPDFMDALQQHEDHREVHQMMLF